MELSLHIASIGYVPIRSDRVKSLVMGSIMTAIHGSTSVLFTAVAIYRMCFIKLQNHFPLHVLPQKTRVFF